MKKFITAVSSLCLAAALSAVCFAAGPAGDIYERNDDARMEVTSDGSLIPGKTYYIYLVSNDDVNNKVEEKPTKVSAKYECRNNENDKKFSIMSTSLSVSKKKLADDSYAYFAELKLKEIPVGSYSYDGFILDITDFKVSPWGVDLGGEIQGTHNVEYPQGNEITDDLQFFELDDTTDTFDVENTDVEVAIDSTGVKTKAIISCDTSYDSAFGEKNSTANLDFFYFNGATLKRQATITIPMGSSKYLYERTASGLKEITKTSGSKFVFKTATLGKYVLSDKRLSTTSDSAQTSTPAASETVSSAVSTTTPAESLPNLPGAPTGGYVPYNPGTGAAL